MYSRQYSKTAKRLCEQSVIIVIAGVSAKYPRFLGNGYVALSLPQGGFDQLTATIVCRPETNNGLLLLNTHTIDARRDFFSVALVDGRATFTYVLSSTVIRSSCMSIWSYMNATHDTKFNGMRDLCIISLNRDLTRDTLTLSPPTALRLYILPYWSDPPFLIFDIRALWHCKYTKSHSA